MEKEMTFEEWRNYGRDNFEIIPIFWSKNDIRDYAESILEVELIEEEVSEIAYDLHRYFDAEYGINWDTISIMIRDKIKERGA
ncbi:MAG: hypothetical protein M0R74_11710 [Dehalococcoidia bacterium]|jgi:hypothetical protein|nr:hypothetical protein [Dehalococcoidia bacterium]